MGFNSKIEKLSDEMQEHASAIQRLSTELDDVLNDLAEEIENLPDNLNITRTSGTFTISSAAIGTNLDPKYYDFKFQYREIVARMKQYDSPITAMRFLHDIMETGVMRFGKKLQLHPYVVAHVRKLLED